MIAWLWGGISPAELRDVTRAEYLAMVAHLEHVTAAREAAIRRR